MIFPRPEMLARTDLLLYVNASILMAVLFCSGCQPDDPIVKRRVEKSRSGLEALQSKPAGVESDRMVVAIFELDESTWFFKLVGSDEQVTEAEAQWKPFLESVIFKDEKPEWELPGGWNAGGPRPMRFETLTIGGSEPPLELIVSSLGPGQDLLMNVNRWREQMGLARISDSDLSQDTQPLKSTVGSALLFDVKGIHTEARMPPFASGAHRPLQTVEKMESSQTHTDSPIKFKTPIGWESGPTSSMVPVRLQKTEGEKMAQISVVNLPAAVNEWTPNTKRWANEVEMSDLSDAELESLTSQIKVDGIEGQRLKLIPEQDDKTRATIAAMIKQNETAWFVKLTGDKTIVTSSEADFETFLNSIELPK